MWPLDGSDPSRWEELVSAPAAAVLQARLRGEDPPPSVIVAVPKQRVALPPEERNMTFRCEQCGRAFLGLDQFNVHLRGNKHKHVLAKLRRAQQVLVHTLDAYEGTLNASKGTSGAAPCLQVVDLVKDSASASSAVVSEDDHCADRKV